MTNTTDIVEELKKSAAYKTLEDAFHRQNEIVQNLAAAVYTCDQNGFIKSYNKAAVDLWAREPVIGKDLWCGSWKIYEADGTPLSLDTCPMAIALKEGKSVRGYEVVVERPDGQRRNVMPYPDPIFNSSGEVVGAVNLLVDITDLKQKEKALKESEISYKRLAEQLEAALKTEEEFMSIASHELKTPITSIKLFVDLLHQSTEHGIDDKGKHFLSRVQIQVDKLIVLIKELIDATKIKSGSLELHNEAVSVNHMIKDLIDDVKATAPKHSFKVHEIGDAKIYCDKNRIEQVIINLLTNAIKYSKPGSNIDITISDNKDHVQVSVSDQGKGIEPESISKIFDRFFRAHQEDEGILSSVGLGLYISRDIITRHNGKIWADSLLGRGSVFHFTLPKGFPD